MNINDFIQNNTPKKKTSVFDEHSDDINKLIELNYSQKQVIEFLKAKCKNKKGLSEANLSKYLKKPTNENNKNNKMNKIQNIKSDITSTEEDLLNLVGSFKKLV
ncbi:hypothetical protein N5U00_10550 [Aliarcobacter butzleri]|uniref:hypothetical protein n=1 Tax=Aliarcobacter butzleri TaxID=28197 RepID=UPI0021B16CFE|nr:hypothetical protein [Aliarcobacter butzleri]MCT7571423.1 hypothetical protein [Aliarcobacter butzleri]MCT7573584.1 hypothetical protein [Aliarcobacter butzleri]MCT7575769.1 hypothetical protein [Aliarcobacter butzleri]MCT7579833.1 hypothetical protein [Aliarcobacter butzleri]